MVTIIPLYFVYKLVNDPKNKRSKDLEELINPNPSIAEIPNDRH